MILKMQKKKIESDEYEPFGTKPKSSQSSYLAYSREANSSCR